MVKWKVYSDKRRYLLRSRVKLKQKSLLMDRRDQGRRTQSRDTRAMQNGGLSPDPFRIWWVSERNWRTLWRWTCSYLIWRFTTRWPMTCWTSTILTGSSTNGTGSIPISMRYSPISVNSVIPYMIFRKTLELTSRDLVFGNMRLQVDKRKTSCI